MTEPNPDLQRMREEYARRASTSASGERYSRANPANEWNMLARRRAMVDFLERYVGGLSELRVLDMGCGSGGVLTRLIELGADPAKLIGVDLLQDRLSSAKANLPKSAFVTANGQYLPFPEESFDLVLQFTAFSPVLDKQTKRMMADEIVRVLKPGQGLLWYDFIWNPLNQQTRGIALSEIRELFPYMRLISRRITLAPPIARKLVPRFKPLADWLTKLKILNSHLLLWIQKPRQ